MIADEDLINFIKVNPTENINLHAADVVNALNASDAQLQYVLDDNFIKGWARVVALVNGGMFIVGGAVRDSLMGKPVSDIDYVVTNQTPQSMIALGFSQVGAAFPVFLHPHTGDEYALARTELKTGAGYHGFSVEFGPGCLNPELLAKFAELGYDPSAEYDVQELLEVLQRIT